MNKEPTVLDELARLNKDINDTRWCIRMLERLGIAQSEIDSQKAYLDTLERERAYIEGLLIRAN